MGKNKIIFKFLNGGEIKMTGLDKARQIAESLKEGVKMSEEKNKIEMAEAKKSLDVLKVNANLAQLYQDSASIGSENLASEVPLLKVHAAGRSTTNILADGRKPNDGWFYYKPTKEQFETVECHILTISRGFRADGLQNDKNEKKSVFNQLVAGVMSEGGIYKPFVMYFTGLKLQSLWDFGKQASAFTKAKPVSIPMFALSVKLSTKEVSHEYGVAWVIGFEIMSDAEGYAKIVTDEREFKALRDLAIKAQDTVTSIIDAKKREDEEMVEPSKEITLDENGMPF